MASGKHPILFAFDGSAFAETAIRQAATLLGPGAAIVLTVWQPIETIAFGPVGMSGSEVTSADNEMAARAHETAEAGTRIATEAGFDAAAVTEPQGDAVWSTIIKVADSHDAGLIVMGSHGRTGIPYVLKGSVATAVTHHARRPVMIVPRPA